MDKVLFIDVAGRWGVFTIAVRSALIWNLFSVGFVHARFERYLAQIEYPNTRRRALLTPLRRRRHRHFMGGTWLVNRAQRTVIVVAISLLFMLFCRSVGSLDALEFGRGGALIVVLGLVSILLGFFESERILNDWSLMAKRASTRQGKQTIQERAVRPREIAQLRATCISVVISVIGTIIWAYGDQMMACGVFHWANIEDATQVMCPR